MKKHPAFKRKVYRKRFFTFYTLDWLIAMLPTFFAQTKKIKVPTHKKISPDLFGLFYEDINYSAAGGHYAVQLQNRSFEYNPPKRKEWHPLTYREYMATGFSFGSISVETYFPVDVK